MPLQHAATLIFSVDWGLVITHAQLSYATYDCWNLGDWYNASAKVPMIHVRTGHPHLCTNDVRRSVGQSSYIYCIVFV